jgi:hypothetical protein
MKEIFDGFTKNTRDSRNFTNQFPINKQDDWTQMINQFHQHTNYLKESSLIFNRTIIGQTFNYVPTKLRIPIVHFPRVNRKREKIIMEILSKNNIQDKAHISG